MSGIVNSLIDKLNIATDDNLTLNYDHQTYPVLDAYPIKKLTKQQRDIINETNDTECNVYSPNTACDPTSKLYLECRNLLKITEATTQKQSLSKKLGRLLQGC